ncbi:unnamed protein product, partial [Orchesella dallaii]
YRFRGPSDNGIALWIMITTIIGASCSFFSIFILPVAEFDTFYFLVEDFLPEKMFRTSSTILWAILFRA